MNVELICFIKLVNYMFHNSWSKFSLLQPLMNLMRAMVYEGLSGVLEGLSGVREGDQCGWCH